jgi:tetratricopeptide (TPR) repeat protein
MKKNKNLTIEETLNLAIKNHQEGKTDIALNLYNKILEIDPNHSQALNNLAVIFTNLKNYQKARACYEKAIKINPNYADAHNNLGIIFEKLGDLQKAKECYERAIEINPNYADAHYNIGIIFNELGDLQKAKECYEKAIEINPNYTEAHNNLGVVFRKLGENQKAKECYKKAIEINPNHSAAHNNLGVIFQQLGENKKANDCYEQAIKINPNHVDTHWNLHGLSTDIDEALLILKKLYKIDNNHIKSKIMISALEGYKGDFKTFNEFLNSSHLNHPFVRSVKWVFSLPKLPNIFFDRWLFFDAVIKLTDNSRPFYEFGVWNGVSFQYLINTFKKGFGFDTFSGLPEAWQKKPKGAYSSYGVVPKIEGGEFIIGKFEDTLPNFFSTEQPMASLINFDADLYSSTLCALNNSNKVIDKKTILIFDELIINDKWEEDEYKALNEFCGNLGYNYEVIAVSFFTKQVAIKLKKN